jgi:hypothetical protein
VFIQVNGQHITSQLYRHTRNFPFNRPPNTSLLYWIIPFGEMCCPKLCSGRTQRGSGLVPTG